MSLGYNDEQVIIIGNCGQDPELKYTPQGIAVCNFSVAVNTTKGKGESKTQTTKWFRIVVWREKAETASKWIHKGMKLMVIGTVETKPYLDKQGKAAASLELTCEEFKFLDSKGDNTQSAGGQTGVDNDGTGAFDDDEIPF